MKYENKYQPIGNDMCNTMQRYCITLASVIFMVFFIRNYLDMQYYVDMDINAIKVNEVVDMSAAPPRKRAVAGGCWVYSSRNG